MGGFSSGGQRRCSVGLMVVFAMALGASSVGAQATKADSQRVKADSEKAKTDSSKIVLAKRDEPLFTSRDAIIGAGFVLTTVALLPVDTYVARHLQDSREQTNRRLRHVATNLELLTSPGAFILSGGVYAVGRLGHFDHLADLGWHVAESVLLAQAATEVVKGVAGRSRPFVTGDTVASAFQFARGFRDPTNSSSFPSGHTATAFALASATASEIGKWRDNTPWVAGPLLYTAAGLVGLSRMYHNKHWASDVALGAAIGTFSGLKTVQYAHTHPKNRLDRIFLHPTVSPTTAGGFALAWTIPFSP